MSRHDTLVESQKRCGIVWDSRARPGSEMKLLELVDIHVSSKLQVKKRYTVKPLQTGMFSKGVHKSVYMGGLQPLLSYTHAILRDHIPYLI